MPLAIVAVVAMYAAFLLVGWLGARKVGDGTPADLMLAGRQMPVIVAALTMTATWVDGGYLLGTAEGVYKSSIQLGVQGGLCFGISLIVGGIVFAGTMRRYNFTTLIDPFEARFGKAWAAALVLPALAGELFWSAELLVAIGSTFGVLLGLPLSSAIVLSAGVTTAYTMLGGLWSVAYTDIFQLGLVAIGMIAALPFVLHAAGGLGASWLHYAALRPDAVALVPLLRSGGPLWNTASAVSWWDMSLMLIFGGIPWNCYFQRVLSCQTPARARAHSVLAGVLTMAFVVPPLLMGVAAVNYPWPPASAARLRTNPAETLPLLFAHAVPPVVAFLGLAAVVGAVTSSFSSSILSAGSMFSWNGLKRLVWPTLSLATLRRVIRLSILLFGAIATVLALKVQSVQALWFFTGDLVFVLLFPQLVCALFDPHVNRVGSMAAFTTSLILRAGGGEPLLGLPHFIPYPEIFSAFLSGTPADWYDTQTGAMLFPFKTVAAVVGLAILPIISRATRRWDRPRPLHNPVEREDIVPAAAL